MLDRRPGLATRAKMAWRILRGRQRQTKAPPFAWPTWRQGKPQWQLIDYETYVNEGFNLNTLIYSTIMYKARSMSAAPLRAYEGDPDNPEPLPPDHDLSKLLARPNPHQSGDEFQRQNTAYLNVSGNCYVYKDGMNEDGLPTAMYSMRPDRVFIVPDKTKRGVIDGYLYQPEGAPRTQWKAMKPEQVMHIKFPNPGDPLEGMGYGLSPISPMARSANVDNDVTHFLKLFCDKGTMLMGILEFPADAMIDEAEIGRIKERWRDMYGGYEKWASEVGVLPQGGQYRRLMPAFEELGFESIDERNEARILGPFGVPLELIPTRLGQKHSTFSNRREARRAFWEDTMVPEARLFEVEYKYHLQGGVDEYVAYDLSKVPALRRDIKEQIEGAYKMWSMGTPRDIAYQVVGLDVEQTDGGNESYLPVNILPVGGEVPQLPEGGGGASVEEEESKARPWLSEEQKDRLWQRYNRIAIVWEQPFRNQGRELFKQDKKALSARITHAERKAIEDKATIDWQQLRNDWLDYIDASRKDWAVGMQPMIEGLAREQATQLDATFGAVKQAEIAIDWDIVPTEALEWVGAYTMQFADEVATVTAGTMEGLLAQAVEEGWSARKLRTNMGKVFQQWTEGDLTPAQFEWFAERMPKYRLDMIARTETIRASNKGAQERYRSWGVPYNEWYTAKDERTCDFCAELHGTVYGTEETLFYEGQQMNVQVGELTKTLRFGYEDVTCPPLHPNCRCTLLPRMEPGVGRLIEAEVPSGPGRAKLRATNGKAETDKAIDEIMMQGKPSKWTDEMLTQHDQPWEAFSSKQMEDAKRELVTELSNRTGLSYEDVNNVIRQWAESSNEGMSLQLQQAIAEEFGVPLSQWQQERIAYYAEQVSAQPLLPMEDMRALVRAQYEWTQETLATHGIEEMTLYRGFTEELTADYLWLEEGAEVAMDMNAVSSWSMMSDTAEVFAEVVGDEVGYVMRATVPKERVLSTARTGWGCLGEFETVVLGSVEQDVGLVLGVL